MVDSWNWKGEQPTLLTDDGRHSDWTSCHESDLEGGRRKNYTERAKYIYNVKLFLKMYLFILIIINELSNKNLMN